jgi:hypothetical protein
MGGCGRGGILCEFLDVLHGDGWAGEERGGRRRGGAGSMGREVTAARSGSDGAQRCGARSQHGGQIVLVPARLLAESAARASAAKPRALAWPAARSSLPPGPACSRAAHHQLAVTPRLRVSFSQVGSCCTHTAPDVASALARPSHAPPPLPLPAPARGCTLSHPVAPAGSPSPLSTPSHCW